MSGCGYYDTCLRPVYFPPPSPEHTESIVRGMLADRARSWGLPDGTMTVTPDQIALLRGLAAGASPCVA